MPFQGHGGALALQSSADVQPYFVTNQENILQKTEFGFFVRISSYDCLKATGVRSRKVSMSAEFMFMSLLHCLSAMPWVTLRLVQLLFLVAAAMVVMVVDFLWHACDEIGVRPYKFNSTYNGLVI
jgi:hypothetical protein